MTGTPQNYSAGALTRIYIPLSSEVQNRMVDGLLVQHAQDGTHTAVTATSVATDTITEKTAAAGVTIDSFAIKDGSPKNWDMWVTPDETWVYVSASSFKVTGVNVTAKYPAGTRVKWTQTTVKYGTVASSSFSTDTTVNIIVNTDYTIANAAITANYYSYAASPQGYPTAFTYAPTLVGFSANPTATVYKYSVVGNQCTLFTRQGTSGTSNSTSFTLTLPVTAKTIADQVWFGAVFDHVDNGAAVTAVGRAQILSAATTVSLLLGANGGSWTAANAKKASYQITYEF